MMDILIGLDYGKVYLIIQIYKANDFESSNSSSNWIFEKVRVLEEEGKTTFLQQFELL